MKFQKAINEDIAGEYDRSRGILNIYAPGEKGVEYKQIGSISYENLKAGNYSGINLNLIPAEHLKKMFQMLNTGKYNGNDGMFDFRFKVGDMSPSFVKPD